MSPGPSGSSAVGDSSGSGSLAACCCEGRTFGSNPEAASSPQAESVKADARARPAKINGRDLIFTIYKTPHAECHKKIGRASCRERVKITAVIATLKKNMNNRYKILL